MLRRILLPTLLASLTGCQAVPTKVVEKRQREFIQVISKAQKPIEFSPRTVILDSRAAFDYGLNRVQNSVNFSWTNLSENERTGELLRNSRQAVIRLSLLGITPQTPVVVVGSGPAGLGEEGRLAWNLLYLGIQDVQVSAVEPFRKMMTTSATQPALNEKEWPPVLREELQISKAEFLMWATHPRERIETRVFVIDVRSPKEYLNRPETVKAKGPQPDINAIHIEWKSFYTGQGRPDPAFKAKLTALGIENDDQIVLISNRGVRSAAAAYALIALGYSKAQNFTGGWNSVLK